ncbi:uncharacterized protein N7459_004865 [Penicillium hispanicum]|uniref:uncharacterized protein n=1 Tax=Penicillium hispanicum TaxID=1080232 RepID=UPI002540CC62|nr:uncharacterized protein N7459_004865 [Penicillium hispanicum]KAJ5585065.1 hypothetical protein N7459_004865 [Penicillium hispanicum]
MQRVLFTEGELIQARERRLKYHERLRNIFRRSYCQQFEVANYVPSAMSRQVLKDAIQTAGLPA